jgi:uncharacterized protein DUF3221
VINAPASFLRSDRSAFAGENRFSEPFATISYSLVVQKELCMRKLRFILLALTLILACLLEGVQSFSSSRIDVRGVITSVTLAEGKGRGKVLARVLIEGAKEPDTQVDKASVTVTAETEVFIKSDGERKPAEFAALKEGQRVEARFTGPVRESYPVQAAAAEIAILEE